MNRPHPQSQFEKLRTKMVASQLAGRGIRDDRVLDVMANLARELFLPPNIATRAYEDRALPVGLGQTISQPYIAALMTELLSLEPSHRVLEIGTGTGYQTAILARLARHVFSVERIESLSRSAAARLKDLDITNVTLREGDGTLGWPDHAPFDRAIVTAAAPAVVQPLIGQLIEGGRLVIPIGDDNTQHLTVIEKHRGRIVEHPSIAVRFVKLIGQAGFES